MSADVKVLDGEGYVVVIDHRLGIIYRVRKPRVGLMRFSRPTEGRKPETEGSKA